MPMPSAFNAGAPAATLLKMKCRWGNLLMNMAVNFKFGCACAGNLQGLMSVISVASEFGSVLR